jgi:YfiH family protein
MTKSKNILTANWQAPSFVRTLITQANTLSSLEKIDDKELNEKLNEGLNKDSFGFNIGLYVGDDPQEVLQRRSLLEKVCNLPVSPSWITQVRGSEVLCLEDEYINSNQEADASFTFEKNRICVVTSADCIPVFLTDTKGQFVAAIHAGWQGLHGNIINNCITRIRKHASSISVELSEIVAFIAPAISQNSYQVDEVFYQRFVDLNQDFDLAFKQDQHSGKFLADIKKIAKLQLSFEGIGKIVDCEFCTYKSNDFYSHRKATHMNKKNTGRFASMIWIEGHGN